MCSSGGGGGAPVDDTDPGTPADIDVDLVAAFASLLFARPVKLVQHPVVDERWYVVEQAGRIRTFLETDPENTLSLALDISTSVNLGDTTREQGLLGLAFEPGFDGATETFLYITYTDAGLGRSVLARYESTDGGLTFTATTEPIVLSIPRNQANHNGGDVHFGPDDDYLYYTTGDGGGSGDPDDNGQDPTTLLGSVLRLDVDSAPALGESYVIPADNPFQGTPLCESGVSPTDQDCPELFAYGLRNPWRMSFDSANGELWLGDVGQDAREEIDFIVAGGNYGWRCVEGDEPFAVPPCTGTFVAPESVHPHPIAQSITGGIVYRGSAIPDLIGFYVYGDFVTGNYWALDTGSMDPPLVLGLPRLGMSAFAEDRRDGELYVVTFQDPSIYRLVPDPAPPPP